MSSGLHHQVNCEQCYQPMRWRRGRHWWEGDMEYSQYEYECQNACQTRATVKYETFIPPEVARMRAAP